MGLMKRPELIYWMIVNSLSGAVVFTLLWFLFFALGFGGLPQVDGRFDIVLLVALLYIVVPALLMGAALGLGQGLTLFEEWRCRWRWMLVSISGMVPAVLCVVFTHQLVFGGMQTVVNYLITGAAVGLIVAAVQWLELRLSIEVGFLHWVWFNTLVWGLSVAVGWLSAWIIGGGALLVVSVCYAFGLLAIRESMGE